MSCAFPRAISLLLNIQLLMLLLSVSVALLTSRRLARTHAHATFSIILQFIYQLMVHFYLMWCVFERLLLWWWLLLSYEVLIDDIPIDQHCSFFSFVVHVCCHCTMRLLFCLVYNMHVRTNSHIYTHNNKQQSCECSFACFLFVVFVLSHPISFIFIFTFHCWWRNDGDMKNVQLK